MAQTIKKISHVIIFMIKNMEHKCIEIWPKVADFIAKISDFFVIFSV